MACFGFYGTLPYGGEIHPCSERGAASKCCGVEVINSRVVPNSRAFTLRYCAASLAVSQVHGTDCSRAPFPVFPP